MQLRTMPIQNFVFNIPLCGENSDTSSQDETSKATSHGGSSASASRGDCRAGLRAGDGGRLDTSRDCGVATGGGLGSDDGDRSRGGRGLGSTVSVRAGHISGDA